MKKCAYCDIPVPKKEREFFTTPYSSMSSQDPICNRCVLEIQPELITGIIGNIDEFS